MPFESTRASAIRLRQETEPRRILLVINSLRGGGAERQLSQMARYWAASGQSVTMATFTTPENARDFYELPSSINRVHLGVNLGFLRIVPAIQALTRAIRLEQPDGILSFSDVPNMLTWLAGLITGCRTTLAVRANPNETISSLAWIWRLPIRMAYRLCHRLAVQTTGAACWIQQSVGREATVIPNALRQMRMPNAPREKLILAIGSLLIYKGHDVLLRAFSLIHEKFPEWNLTILGDGPQRCALQSLASELNINKKLVMPGKTKEVEDWLERASIFVLPSRQEGFPNALIEAMAMGVAPISTSCDYGPGEIISDGRNGCLVPVDDVQAMANALRGLLENPGFRIDLGTAAQEVRGALNESKIMGEWEKLMFGTSLHVSADAEHIA